MGEQNMNSQSCEGMTLIEVMVAIFLVAVTALGVAPVFLYATNNTEIGRVQGLIGAVALERMEALHAEDYDDLMAGGSLTSNVEGYSETDDAGYELRWSIDDNDTPPETKIVQVRALAPVPSFGVRKETTLSTMRAR